jgi:hypothetical protein
VPWFSGLEAAAVWRACTRFSWSLAASMANFKVSTYSSSFVGGSIPVQSEICSLSFVGCQYHGGSQGSRSIICLYLVARSNKEQLTQHLGLSRATPTLLVEAHGGTLPFLPRRQTRYIAL